MTPFIAAGWSEEEARDEFRKLRFARWGGQPYCDKCDSPGVNCYKKRPIYKCKLCGRQFSLTSGTPWAHRKIPFKKLMFIIASFVMNKQALPAMALSENLDIQYKTALVWLHRLRAGLKGQADSKSLIGEVEVDGAEIGGFIRPKNVRKERKDHRKIPFRAKDRTFHIVGARQRGGPIRTWVARLESHAVDSVMGAIDLGSTVFADRAQHWSRLATRFDLRQVNHNEAFSTPDACTNQIESVWSLVRVMGRVHRHIAQNYLDLYLAEAAWTVETAHNTVNERFAEVMAAMSVPGSSIMTGYYQGRKRGCEIVLKEGGTSVWKPDLLRRPVRLGDNGKLEEVPTRRPRSKTWMKDFNFVVASDFIHDPTIVDAGPGVYVVCLRDGADYPLEIVQEATRIPAPWTADASAVLYTGESYGLRSRLLEHFTGDVKVSNLRHTLLAVHWRKAKEGGLPVKPDRAAAEAATTDWMTSNLTIGFKSCGYVKEVEREILYALPTPLNVQRPNPNALTRQIKAMRSEFSDQVMAGWAPAPATKKRYRR